MEMMIVMTNIQNARKIAVRKLVREKKYEKKIREQRINVWVTTDLKGDTQISEMEETTIELIEGSQLCAKENV